MESDPGRAYAEEVYASCATVGFAGDDVSALKRMLDANRSSDDPKLLELAKRAQAEAIRWATRGGGMPQD